MGLRTRPSQRQKRLGQELQHLREAAGLSGTDAGAHIGMGRAHMSHVEAGRTHIPPEKLRTLASLYGCNDAQLIKTLIELSQATGRGWWSSYKRFTGTRVRELAELEASATAHQAFQWLYIPGLLQTPGYMRALFARSKPDLPLEIIDEQVEFRLRRQQALTEEPLPQYHAVVHETAFHMHFVNQKAMREQLAYLLEVSQFPNVDIQVLPFSADAHPATPGTPFTVLETGPLHTVYVEHPITSLFLSDKDQIDQFRTDFARLSNVALAPLDTNGLMGAGSLGLIQHLLYVLQEGKHVGP